MTDHIMREDSISAVVKALRAKGQKAPEPSVQQVLQATEDAIDEAINSSTAVQVAHTHAPEPTERYRPEPVAPDMFSYHLRMVLIDVENFLLEKNRMYGNSALQPMRVFSRADPMTQIDVRIDDKLSRMKHRQTDDTEDTERDTLGYLILKEVVRRMGG